jgi:hypothetical protein
MDGAFKGYGLTPPERRIASFLLKRRGANPTPASVRMQNNYGPVGAALFGVACAVILFGAAVAVSGMIDAFLAGESGPRASVGNWISGAGVVLMLPGIIRISQASRVARKYRGGRPLQRK